jgi:regulation of enolase protein 1 (concanavalin A-like superfamily)
MKVDFTKGEWINAPRVSKVGADAVEITTDPFTDFWQRSYYGFRNDNAPAVLLDTHENFSFTTRVEFTYRARFDQCGVLVYVDSDNWFKASIENENARFSRLGSVVTNLGYSDWATTDIECLDHIWYRLSRRGPDMLAEQSVDGESFRQMRIFHLHCLGETTAEMGKLDPPAPANRVVRYGLYACSPLESSFKAKFTEFDLTDCQWRAHG